MPTYLGKDVSDDYLQGLIGAYRDGQRSVDEALVEDGDQVIIDRLTKESIQAQPGARKLGESDASIEQQHRQEQQG